MLYQEGGSEKGGGGGGENSPISPPLDLCLGLNMLSHVIVSEASKCAIHMLCLIVFSVMHECISSLKVVIINQCQYFVSFSVV